MQKWYNELKDNCKVSKITVAVAGNKADLDEDVSLMEARLFAKSINAEYFTISAKTGMGI